jgi:hypothetical protein
LLTLSNACLYDLWVANSVPMVPTNGVWPTFSEKHILEFTAGTAVEPQASSALNTQDALTYLSRIQSFLDLLETLSEDEYACKPQYVAFEQERLATYQLFIKTQDPVAMSSLNDRLYGRLVDMHAANAVGHLSGYVHDLEPASSDVADAQALLLAAWTSPVPQGTVTRQMEAINHYRLALRAYVSEQFGFVKEAVEPFELKPRLTSEDVAQVLNQAIVKVLGDSSDWSAVVLPGKPNVFVNLHERTVTIPQGRFYSMDAAATLAIHEVGVHAQRAAHGAHSLEKLAGVGLPGYGPTEEAFGVLLGNASHQKYHQINSLIPFAVIDYASQVDTPSFRKVYQFARALIICLANPTEETYKRKLADFERAAFSRTIRVLRMGTGGIIERSTTKYWNGQLLLCKYFDTHGTSNATITQFLLGKYDCFNQSQLELIKYHTNRSRHA